ncbi:hydroxyacid dehydrogenase [Mediterraneibacter gnavus]|mgnify:CR=1 FL=1|uniref:NAD(P)-dependent oxidoreductase n=1 Tax=Mediterraneibacter gnavus TaxID=33038 RepID=UPI000E499CF0|nr:NAD(P)-dependent oxidoreductase [Mediterraneibacter gnavus]RHE74632.1 hydroxyacid dehydrogenase [Mediterraneibacter gnavus]
MKLLITGAITWNEKQKKELQKLGHELIYIQDERIPLEEQGINPKEIEGIICNGLFLYNEISDFKSLQYIQLTSAGFDRVPMNYIKEHSIEIHNARGVYSIPMAEFAVGGVLQLYKQSKFFYKNQKEHCWVKNRDIVELFGKTVCIVGCGSVGAECAKRFKAFDCKILGVDLYPKIDERYVSMVSLADLDKALSISDIVILTVPLTEETRHLMNAQRLNNMKIGAVLVNISRGAVVDNEALMNVLPKFSGAVLDVFEKEPLSKKNPLWEMENVIVTPHNSFVGNGNRERLQGLIIENLDR